MLGHDDPRRRLLPPQRFDPFARCTWAHPPDDAVQAAHRPQCLDHPRHQHVDARCVRHHDRIPAVHIHGHARQPVPLAEETPKRVRLAPNVRPQRPRLSHAPLHPLGVRELGRRIDPERNRRLWIPQGITVPAPGPDVDPRPCRCSEVTRDMIPVHPGVTGRERTLKRAGELEGDERPGHALNRGRRDRRSGASRRARRHPG
jgi:hypothetical protein